MPGQIKNPSFNPQRAITMMPSWVTYITQMIFPETFDGILEEINLDIKERKKVLNFIAKNNRPPTIMEIAEGAKSSTASIKKYLKPIINLPIY